MAKTDPITPPQVNFIELLASERDISTLTLEQQAWLRTPDALRTISRGKASEIIQLLKQLPKLATEQPTVNKPTEPLPVGFDIDKGRYFVVDLSKHTSVCTCGRPINDPCWECEDRSA